MAFFKKKEVQRYGVSYTFTKLLYRLAEDRYKKVDICGYELVDRYYCSSISFFYKMWCINLYSYFILLLRLRCGYGFSGTWRVA